MMNGAAQANTHGTFTEIGLHEMSSMGTGEAEGQ